MLEFLSKLFDGSDFPARWHCGRWTAAHGWLHIFSDAAIFLAYLAIPAILAYTLIRRKDAPLPLPRVLGLFIAFILLCGITHLNEALIFWQPVYRFAGTVKLATALTSWATVLVLIPVVPKVLFLRTPESLHRDVEQATRALREERDAAAELSAIVSSSRDAIISTDLTGRVRSWNSGAEAVYGYVAAESIGSHLQHLIGDQSRQELESLLGQAASERSVREVEAEHRRKDGQVILVSLSVSPVLSREGQLIGASVIARDISERRRAELRLQEAESQFRDLYERAPDMYVSIDPKTHLIVQCNHTTQERLGYSKNQLVGKPVLELYAPDCRSDAEENLQHSLDHEGRSGSRLALRASSGERVDVNIKVTTIRDRSGGITELRLAWQDITDQKQAEALFEIAVDASPSGMIVTDADGVIVLVNREGERLFGYAKQELIGQSVETLVPTEYRREHPQLRAAFSQKPVARKMGVSRSLSARRKDGSHFPIEVGLNPIETPRGRMVLTAVVDRTEVERQQRHLEEGREELKRSNADLERFAYVASHDLKAPLRALQNAATWISEDLPRELLTEDMQENLDMLVGRAKRMEALLNALLDYARAGRDSEYTEVDTGALLADVLELLAPPADVHVLVPEPLPKLMSSRVPLEQVFANLVSNALKHAPHRPLTITVACVDSGPDFLFSVADDGPGIDPRHHQKIFDVFQTLRPRDEVEGTGIGLALVKKTVESHGGHITVESRLGEGAKFSFTWPKVPRMSSAAGAL